MLQGHSNYMHLLSFSNDYNINLRIFLPHLGYSYSLKYRATKQTIMGSTVPRNSISCFHKPKADGIGVSEMDIHMEEFSEKGKGKPIPLKNYQTGEVYYDTLHHNAEKV